MASRDVVIPRTAAEVFATLSDGWTYSGWVVGTSHIRAVDADWPAPGTRIHHASGAWPAVIRDDTVVEEVEPDRRLVLTARGGPFGEARITVELASEGPATRVTMTETPISGPGKWVDNPVSEALLGRRIAETLARLAALVDRPTTPAD
jgi:uncharacterized protein YndB with AHSA1/START domain